MVVAIYASGGSPTMISGGAKLTPMAAGTINPQLG